MKKNLIDLTAVVAWILVLLGLVALAGGCKKADTCLGPGQVGLRPPGIITWTNPVPVIIEIQGIDGPYHGLMTPSELLEHRVEGHARVRVKTDCSPWSNWIEINKP